MSKASINDKRLQRVYGLTLAEYEAILKYQGGVCAICKRPPVTRKLAVDHDHKLKYSAKMVRKDGEFWHQIGGIISGQRRSDVVNTLKNDLRRKSIRGLLCPSCNRGLKFFRDNQYNLSEASVYLRQYEICPIMDRSVVFKEPK